MEEVAAVLKINLKFLFNFHCIRISFHWEGFYIHFTISVTGAKVEVLNDAAYLPQELLLLEQKRPIHWTKAEVENLPLEYQFPEEEQPELWGWLFQNKERQILVSLLSGTSKPFTRRDITFVKLMAECLESKLLELCLFQELDKRNAEISSINSHQQEVIKQRTAEIAKKNERLMEISILNAHQFREPLSRILGLVKLMEHANASADLKKQIIPRLGHSARDLDSALREVIEKATSELAGLRADNE